VPECCDSVCCASQLSAISCDALRSTVDVFSPPGRGSLFMVRRTSGKRVTQRKLAAHHKLHYSSLSAHHKLYCTPHSAENKLYYLTLPPPSTLRPCNRWSLFNSASTMVQYFGTNHPYTLGLDTASYHTYTPTIRYNSLTCFLRHIYTLLGILLK
jgi:hypothetical protein